MNKILISLIVLFAPAYAHASYIDGFFAFGVLVVGTPVMIIGIFLTTHYIKSKNFMIVRLPLSIQVFG